MSFNPLKEKGTPIERQVHNWSQTNPTPYDKSTVHPYTRTRVILMNGIEVDAAIFLHNFHRHTDDMELKQRLAMARRIEQHQQKMVNWLVPPDESTLEVTLGYEQVAVDLTARLARTEPDPYVKAALDFALLEDFDHLYRYANLYEMNEGKQAERIVGGLTEITPGRPTISEHRHPFDSVRKHYDRKAADMLTKLHVLTIVAGEQQTMNFYMNVGNREKTEVGRGLYAEIGMIEEQHVTHYGSLEDPRASWFEMFVDREYNECHLYYSCMETESDERIRKIWERHLMEEITHLQMAVSLAKEYERVDYSETLPDEFPTLTVFESNKDYVREILASQTDLTAKETEFVPVEEAPARYFEYQHMVNDGGPVPSQQVIADHIAREGRDYRFESQGPHPVERMRSRAMVTV